jgi:hypothetical protein
VLPYRLPRDVRDRLASALAGRRNHAACVTLATFIARFWTPPRRLGLPFMLDRRALAPVEALGLTEGRIRGAIRALEEAGFLDRAPTNGRTHQATPDGLHRKPVPYLIAVEFRELFARANARAERARRKLPKSKASEAARVYLGKERSAPPPAAPNPSLEAALERWRRAAEWQVRPPDRQSSAGPGP